jgi:glycosyltransferase involved in cell wall biosynthesis
MCVLSMRIACVHQGYELYGSDRCFVESVCAIRKAFPSAEIEVVLPRPGPIVELLQGITSRVLFEPIWVLRRRNILGLLTGGLFRLPGAIARAIGRFRSHDIVYINTSVVTDYIVAARFFPNRALLHIHEMPAGVTLAVLRALVRWSRAEIIFNSRATQAAFALPDATQTHVIYNGIRGPAAAEPATYDGRRKLRLLMLGRINQHKGQDVLLHAIAALPLAIRQRAELRIVGSAFENSEREEALRSLVGELNLGDIASIEPFSPEPASLYRWADIVVVPSIRNESLGRVAIEAMAFGRPPIASAFGGLMEVVEDRRTGWLVPPGRSDALAATLQDIIENPASWRDFGPAGHARYEALFSENAAAAAIASVVAGKRSARLSVNPRTDQVAAVDTG